MKHIVGKKLFFLVFFLVFFLPFSIKALTTGDIIDAAKRRADYITFDFHYGDAPINPAIDDSAHLVSCDRFVGWVVYDLGWTDQPEIQGLVVYDARGINDLSQYLESHGFTKITDYSEIQEGDIMFHNMYGETSNSRHTYIVGPRGPNGDFTRFDAGSEIRLQLTEQYYAYRDLGGQPFYEGVPADSWSYGYRFPDVEIGSATSAGNGKLKDDYANGFPSILTSNNFDCKTIFVTPEGDTELKKILDGIFLLVQVLAPVIAIVFTIIDYMKVAGSINVKKANIRTIKRVVIASIVVFLPFLLDLLFHLFGLYDLSSCGIG